MSEKKETPGDEDCDEEAILLRRRAFVASAIAGVLLVQTEGCKNPFVNEAAFRERQEVVRSQPCLTALVPPPPVSPRSRPDAGPAPTVCLSPRVCLSIRPSRPKDGEET